MKVQRQPKLSAIAGIIIGAMIAPTLVPALKIELASARWRFGNHSATALIADGKLPPSLRPSATRAPKNPPTEPTAAWATAHTLQSVIDTA